MSQTEQNTDLRKKRIVHRAEAAIAQSRNALYEAAPDEVVSRLGLQLAQVGSAMLFGAANVSNLHFNHVAGLGVDALAAQETIDEIEEWYNRKEVPFALSLSLLAQPKEIKIWLERRGYKVERSTAILTMENDLSGIEQPPFDVKYVGSEHAHAFGLTLIEAFGLPPFMVEWMAATVGQARWHHYLVWEGEIAVAAAILQIHNAVGHLGWAATLPAYRGCGIHRALITRRVNDAFSFGCDFVTIDTTYSDNYSENISMRNAERFGFELLYIRPEYRSPNP